MFHYSLDSFPCKVSSNLLLGEDSRDAATESSKSRGIQIMIQLTAWAKYHQLVKRGMKVEHPKLSIFGARYSIARGLPEFQFNSTSSNISESYLVALRIGLAYTALESLESSLSVGKTLQVGSNHLAIFFRSTPNREFMETLIAHHTTEKKLANSLTSFLNGDSENLRFIAYAIRNLMFHGSLTANLLKLDKSKVRRAKLTLLAETILECLDLKFSEYVEEMQMLMNEDFDLKAV